MLLFAWPIRCQSALRPIPSSHTSPTRFLQGFKHVPSRGYKHAYENPASIKQKIGERVLVYHAGVFRTTFVGMVRAAAVLLFVGNILITPLLIIRSIRRASSPAIPLWNTPARVVMCAIPMLAAFWFTKPFVASATLKPIPISGRRSLEHLYRWAEKLPYTSEVEFKMFTWYGTFRRTTVPISQLKTKKPGVGIENLVRIGGPKDEPKLFYVPKESKANLRRELWQKILPQLEAVESQKKP